MPDPLLPAGLRDRDVWALLGISRTRFYRLKPELVRLGLMSPIDGIWSRDKVLAWMRGENPRRLGRVA